MTNERILDSWHWTLPDYSQRITAKQWKQILIKNKDFINFKGNVIQLKAKDIRYGVVEVYKDII